MGNPQWAVNQFLPIGEKAKTCQKCGLRLSPFSRTALCLECKKVPCPYCGTMFYDKDNVFCGRKCSAKGQRRYRPPVCTTPYIENASPAVKSERTMTVSPAFMDIPPLGQEDPQSKGAVVNTCWS